MGYGSRRGLLYTSRRAGRSSTRRSGDGGCHTRFGRDLELTLLTARSEGPLPEIMLQEEYLT